MDNVTRQDHAERIVAGAVALITVLATTSRPLPAQEVIELPAEDRLLDAGFEEVYRLGSLTVTAGMPSARFVGSASTVPGVALPMNPA